jgi:hypothetical protein
MKYVLPGVLIIALLAIPAAALDPNQVSVAGNVSTTCSITVTPSALGFGDMVASPSYYYTPTGNVTVVCNVFPGAVTARDDSSNGKTKGFLWDSSKSKALDQHFMLYNGVGWASLDEKDGPFADWNDMGTFTWPDQFRQIITEFDAPGTYSTTVTFTLS